MKSWLKEELGPWLRHKVRVVILKQWKKPKTIYRNLINLDVAFKCKLPGEDIRKVSDSRLGWYRSAGMRSANFLASSKVLSLPNLTRKRTDWVWSILLLIT